jgi:hypothetical protein
MRIDTSGNVGIGTSTITSTSGFTPKLVLSASSAALIVKGQNSQEVNLGSSNSAFFDCVGNSTGTNNNIIFRNTSTNSNFTPIERMRINSSGNVLINTTSALNCPLQIGSGFGATDGTQRIVTFIGSTDTASPGTAPSGLFVLYTGNATQSSRTTELLAGTFGSGTYGILKLNNSVSIDTSGNLISTTVYAATVGATNRDLFIDNTGKFGYVSSLRESKTEIQDLFDTSWLYELNPVSFKYRKKDEEDNYTDETDGDIQYGMIAEDVETIRPDLCFYDEVDGKKELRGIQYSKLTPVLLKVIQEIKAELDTVKAELAAIKSQE